MKIVWRKKIGLIESISLTLFSLLHAFICFSRLIAVPISSLLSEEFFSKARLAAFSQRSRTIVLRVLEKDV
jgi:hypothetical protein